jgi:hypothetical protein
MPALLPVKTAKFTQFSGRYDVTRKIAHFNWEYKGAYEYSESKINAWEPDGRTDRQTWRNLYSLFAILRKRLSDVNNSSCCALQKNFTSCNRCFYSIVLTFLA